MAEVIHIGLGEKSPKDQDWLLLEKTSSGQYVGNGSAARSPNAIFRIFPPEDGTMRFQKPSGGPTGTAFLQYMFGEARHAQGT